MLKKVSQNPAITSIFTADPSAHVWDGKVYIYASHDMDPARGCDLMDRYHVFSSEDMINWTDEGEILRSGDVKWGRPEGGFMWAPDCAYKNGVYYFYYPHPSGTNWNDTWKIGVATSKHPAKDFTDRGYIEGLGGFAMIDPCVLADDDGKYYIYTGGGSRCEGAELNDDMMSIKESVQMTGLQDFHEATWVFKRNGIYYLTYSDNLHGKNQMRYAISRNPLGPWEYKGIFLEPTDCDTSHGSVAEYKGQWYLFYHNCNISGRGNLRSVCVDYLYFNDDGTIKIVKQTKKDGIKPAGSAPDLSNAEKYTDAEGLYLSVYIAGEKTEITLGEQSICEFKNINGGRGGRATIYINYKTDAKLAKVNLYVNDTDWSLLNMPGDS
ncbi:MAG: family 43 glycosylhydrolase, partial [Oscillospiraceae bacterium]|nr:family 43 glycosylhydrolase [Oscillospiraceae bacterium]